MLKNAVDFNLVECIFVQFLDSFGVSSSSEVVWSRECVFIMSVLAVSKYSIRQIVYTKLINLASDDQKPVRSKILFAMDKMYQKFYFLTFTFPS